MSRDILREHKASIMGTAGAAIVALAGYVLQPVREVVFGSIWKEKAIVEVRGASETALVGQLWSIDVLVTPTTPVGVSEGVLTLTATDSVLHRVDTASLGGTAASKHPFTLPPDGRRFLFRVLRPGRAQVQAVLETTGGRKFAGRTQLVVSSYAVGVRPHEGNFSGRWRFSLGDEFGFMDLTDQDRTLSGRWWIPRTHEHGNIDGWRDGKAFEADLLRSTVSKWQVKAEWNVVGNDLLIAGAARPLTVTDRDWQAAGIAVAFKTSVPLERSR